MACVGADELPRVVLPGLLRQRSGDPFGLKGKPKTPTNLGYPPLFEKHPYEITLWIPLQNVALLWCALLAPSSTEATGGWGIQS